MARSTFSAWLAERNTMQITRNSLVALLVAASGGVLIAQGRNVGFEWPATGADAQRTGWLRLDPKIAPAAINNTDFTLLWQEKLPGAARQGRAVFQGVTANGMQVFTPTSFVTGVSNTIFALDNDTGHPNFVKRFDAPLPAPTANCPGGVTGALTRVVNLVPTPLELPPPPPPSGGYKSGIGAPGEGVPMDIGRRDGGAALRSTAPPPPQQRPGGPPGGGMGSLTAGKYGGAMYAVTSDGALHVLGPNFLLEVERPV